MVRTTSLTRRVIDEFARAISIWATALVQLQASVDYSVDLRRER